MIFIRSFVFNILFYLNMIIWMVGCLPFFFFPKAYLLKAARWWAQSNLWLLEVSAGVKHEFRYLERIPQGKILVASKHQSFWETFTFFVFLDRPIFVLKKELVWIPVFGWYLKKIGCIAVDRTAGDSAMRLMVAKAKKAKENNRQIIIFPEGTRRALGAPPDYKRGVALLYRVLDVPCVPVGLNSGVCWPRRKFIRKPGTIVVEICEVIPPKKGRDEFLEQLQSSIETTSERLLYEQAG